MTDTSTAEKALIDAITGGRTADAMALMEKSPELASAHAPNGVSALMFALYMRQADIADAICNDRDDLDVFESAAVGNVGRLEELLADDPVAARATSPDGGTALHFASFFGQEEATRVLLAHEPDLAAVAPAFGSVQPINSAAASGNAATVRMLLEAGANANARQAAGWTALHAAAKAGNTEMIICLLEHDADASLTADDGSTPLDLARQAKQVDAVAILESL